MNYQEGNTHFIAARFEISEFVTIILSHFIGQKFSVSECKKFKQNMQEVKKKIVL